MAAINWYQHRYTSAEAQETRRQRRLMRSKLHRTAVGSKDKRNVKASDVRWQTGRQCEQTTSSWTVEQHQARPNEHSLRWATALAQVFLAVTERAAFGFAYWTIASRLSIPLSYISQRAIQVKSPIKQPIALHSSAYDGLTECSRRTNQSTNQTRLILCKAYASEIEQLVPVTKCNKRACSKNQFWRSESLTNWDERSNQYG